MNPSTRVTLVIAMRMVSSLSQGVVLRFLEMKAHILYNDNDMHDQVVQGSCTLYLLPYDNLGTRLTNITNLSTFLSHTCTYAFVCQVECQLYPSPSWHSNKCKPKTTPHIVWRFYILYRTDQHYHQILEIIA